MKRNIMIAASYPMIITSGGNPRVNKDFVNNLFLRKYVSILGELLKVKGNLNDIKIAFSEIEAPIRDYFIGDGDKISKIGNVELKVSQWENMYIVTFEYNDIYFDIETTGITESQLVDLLKSIIDNGTNSSNAE